MARPKKPAKPKLHRDPATGAFSVSWTVTEGGKSRTVRRGCNTRDEAMAWDAIPGIVAAYSSEKKVGAGWKVADLIDAYREHRENDPDPDHRPSVSFGKNFRPIRAFFGTMAPAQIGDTTIRRYRNWRGEQDVKGIHNGRKVCDNTAVRELKQLRAAVRWGKRQAGFKAALAGVYVTLPGVELTAIDRAFTHDEVRRILDALEASEHKHLALFARLALALGGRCGAILELTWDRVTWPPLAVPIISGGTDEEIRENWSKVGLVEPIRIDMGKGKGKKRRPSGLVDRSNTGLYFALMRALVARKSDDAHIVSLNDSGKRLASVNLDPYYRKAGIMDVTGNHVWKHTCCTLMLLADIAPVDVAEHVNTSVEIILKHYRNFLPAVRAQRAASLAFD